VFLAYLYYSIGIGRVLVITWSALTPLSYEVTAPQLQSPKAGASKVPLKPLGQWRAVAGADSYELLVSTNPSLANPTIIKTGVYALPSTAWQCNVSLNRDTTYYWKVRAISSDTRSDWRLLAPSPLNSYPHSHRHHPATDPASPGPCHSL